MRLRLHLGLFFPAYPYTFIVGINMEITDAKAGVKYNSLSRPLGRGVTAARQPVSKWLPHSRRNV